MPAEEKEQLVYYRTHAELQQYRTEAERNDLKKFADQREEQLVMEAMAASLNDDKYAYRGETSTQRHDA